jgi:hypothetical protein
VPGISVALVPTIEFSFVPAATHLWVSSLVLGLYAVLKRTKTTSVSFSDVVLYFVNFLFRIVRNIIKVCVVVISSAAYSGLIKKVI